MPGSRLRFRPWRILVRCASPFGVLAMTRLYERDLSGPLPEFRARADVTVTQATEADLEQLAELLMRELPWVDAKAIREFHLDRVRRGARCFVAKIEDQIVHYNWVIFDRVESWPDAPGVSVLKEGEEAYCAYAYTFEVWRGLAIHTEVLSRMLLFLREAGYRTAYTAVYFEHEAAWKTHHRLGWELSGLALSFRPRNRDKMLVWSMVWGPRMRRARAGIAPARG